MAFSYTKDDTSARITAGTKYTSSRGVDTYTYTRGFLKFDISSYGWSLSDITAVELRTYVDFTTGNPNTRLRSAIASDGDDWGAALNATAADFNSTNASIQVTQTVNSTGWWTWTVDKNDLDLSGTIYFRLANTAETGTSTSNFNCHSEQETTNKPVLRVTTVDAATGIQQVIYVMCS